MKRLSHYYIITFWLYSIIVLLQSCNTAPKNILEAKVYNDKGDSCYLIYNYQKALEYYTLSYELLDTDSTIVKIISCNKELRNRSNALTWLNIYEEKTTRSHFTTLERCKILLELNDTINSILLLENIINTPIEVKSVWFTRSLLDEWLHSNENYTKVKRYYNYYTEYLGKLMALDLRINLAKSENERFEVGKLLFQLVKDRDDDYEIMSQYIENNKIGTWYSRLMYYKGVGNIYDKSLFDWHNHSIKEDYKSQIVEAVSIYKWNIFNNLLINKHKKEGYISALNYANDITNFNTRNTDAYKTFYKYLYAIYIYASDNNNKLGTLISPHEIDSILNASLEQNNNIAPAFLTIGYSNKSLNNKVYGDEIKEPMVILGCNNWDCFNDSISIFNYHTYSKNEFKTYQYLDNYYKSSISSSYYSFNIDFIPYNKFGLNILKHEYDKQINKRLLSIREQSLNKNYHPEFSDAMILHECAIKNFKSQELAKAQMLIEESLCMYNILIQKDSINNKSFLNSKLIDALNYRIKIEELLVASTNTPKNDSLIAETYSELASLYLEELQLESATNCCKNAQCIYNNLFRDNKLTAITFTKKINKLAEIYYELEKYEESESAFNVILNIYKELSIHHPEVYIPYVASCLTSIANIHNKRGYLSLSEEKYKKALNYYYEYDNLYDLEIAEILRHLGNINFKNGNYDISELNYKNAIKIYNKLSPVEHKKNIALCICSLGDIYRTTLRLPESETKYKEALNILRTLNNTEYANSTIDYILGALADVYYKTNINKYENDIKKEIIIYDSLSKENKEKYLDSLIYEYSKLAEFYFNNKRYKESQSARKEVVNLCNNLSSEYLNEYKIILSKNLGEMSYTYMLMREYSNAEEYARRGIDIDNNQTWIYTNLASSLLLQGKYSEAEVIYRKYKIIFKNLFFHDLEKFEENGVIPSEYNNDVKKIKELLNDNTGV